MRVIGVAGWSGSGKTTLLVKLIPELRRRGLAVSTLKHAHHAFDVDTPGKDSWAHREAGAREVMISSRHRFALMHELRDQPEPFLHDLIGRMAPVDILLVEGFKTEAHRKIEVHRKANGKPPLFPEDSQIIAVATDAALPPGAPRAIGIDDVAMVADCILAEAEPAEALVARLAVTHGISGAMA